jgi:stage V sporulation protein D (sporulation-specific penicillin-binding protein)
LQFAVSICSITKPIITSRFRSRPSVLILPSSRILDCRGRILAASYISDTIFAEPRAIADIKKTAEDLAGIIDIGPIEISKAILTARNAGYAPIVADIKLTDIQRKQISSLQGIGVESKWERYYPLGGAAAHSVGFIGTEGQGLAGLELQYDKILRGTFGISTFFSDSARRPVGLKSFGGFAQDGSDIVLTLRNLHIRPLKIR